MKKSQVAAPLPVKAGYLQPRSALKDYEEQVIAYFSGRSYNTGFQWDGEKLKKHFDNTCKQMEVFISFQEKT